MKRCAAGYFQLCNSKVTVARRAVARKSALLLDGRTVVCDHMYLLPLLYVFTQKNHLSVAVSKGVSGSSAERSES